MQAVETNTMNRQTTRTPVRLMAVALLAMTVSASAAVIDEARKSYESGDYATAKALLTREIEKNPGFEEAYELLALTCEALDENEQAADTWRQLKTISQDEERIKKARLGLLRARGPFRPETPDDEWSEDPFKVDVGRVDWRGLEEIEDSNYRGIVPPLCDESRHFVVCACNSRMVEVGMYLSEKYLEFLLDKFLDGRAWALRVPVLIYKDHNDYVNVGKNPSSSAGVTFSDHLGKSRRVALYMLDDGELDRDSIEGTLPHELTHVVINEFFGAQETPRWLHEAIARRLEQTRDHYAEAAKTGRDALAGEYYRFRDLFSAENYPNGSFRTWRFYEQSATIVLFLLEHGPESMLAFLEALKDQKGHDAAAAAALGIPEEGAVEELEARWVEWMKNLYIRYLGDEETEGLVEASPVDLSTLTEPFDELMTADHVSNWTEISTDTMDKFKGIGHSREDWEVDRGRLVCDVRGRASGSALAVRADEEPPMVFEFKLRATESPGWDGTIFGVSMLDHRGDDTGIQVMAPLADKRVHNVRCVVGEDISLYLDDKRVGRAPAIRAEDINEDIDHPLALVAYSPVEVWDIRAGLIEEFVYLKEGKDDKN